MGYSPYNESASEKRRPHGWVKDQQEKTRFQQERVIELAGRCIYHYDQVTSTNSLARLLARAGAPEGTIVLAEAQTAGKGRRSRSWDCPAGKGILMSMILRPQLAAKDIPQLTLLVAVAVVESLNQAGLAAVGIKWPNDIIVAGKKICGILAESFVSKKYGQAVIIGIGINVNQEQPDFTPDCRETSTSLKLEKGVYYPRLQLLEGFITRWELNYQNFRESDSGYIRKKWLQYNHTLNRRVTVNQNNEAISGNAVDLGPNGGLLVQLENGAVKEFLADDVSLGRGFYNDHRR